MLKAVHFAIALILLISGIYIAADGSEAFSVAFLRQETRATGQLWAEPLPEPQVNNLGGETSSPTSGRTSLIHYQVTPLEFGNDGAMRLPVSWKELFDYFALPDQILIASMKRHWGFKTDADTRLRLNRPEFSPRAGDKIEVIVN